MFKSIHPLRRKIKSEARKLALACCALMVFGIATFLLYFWHDAAEAARLGGGKSFGSSPSYQRSAPLEGKTKKAK